MKKGKLKFYNRFQEYGLIIDLETGKEYTVSSAEMPGIVIKEGEHVVFDVREGGNGINAIDIRPDIFKINP